MPEESVFKVCNKCKKKWEMREAFLSDENIRLTGYQAYMTSTKGGVLFFKHLGNSKMNCGIDIGINVSKFSDLYDQSLCRDVLYQSKTCNGFCTQVNNLKVCSNKCCNAEIRKMVRDLINKHPMLVAGQTDLVLD